jgi:hypothetical protein
MIQMTLLTYNSKYVVKSEVAVQTTSTTFVDDTQASQIFTLNASKTVLIIYTTYQNNGASILRKGYTQCIKIDATEVANSWDGNYGINYPAGTQSVWVGTLAAGEHTIKGRIAVVYDANGTTLTVNGRVLLIVIFDGDEFQYVDNATTSSTNSLSFVDDPQVSKMFTPSGACKALFLYNVTNSGATEATRGKQIALSVTGGGSLTDGALLGKAPNAADRVASAFTCYAMPLTADSTTVKGRFRVQPSTAGTVTIHRRQFAALLFSDDVLLDMVSSTTAFASSSGSLVNDTQCSVVRTTGAGEVLIVAACYDAFGVDPNLYTGIRYGIMVDTVDRSFARSSAVYSLSCNPAVAWMETIAAAEHTIKGRCSNNKDASEAFTVSARQVAVLWLVTTINAPTVTTEAATALGLD